MMKTICHRRRLLMICMGFLFCLFLYFIVENERYMYINNETFLAKHQNESSSYQSPPIFFLDTSASEIDTRIACAVESAIYHHPHSQITFYFTNQPNRQHPNYVLLSNFSKVQIKFLDVKDIFVGTPLYDWYLSDRLKQSMIPVYHLSDAIRLAILWKFGGIYFD
ncbi:Alpha-1,4-N-acetylglucosaminyltransferase [Chamberlinius hualienensis]